MNKSFGLTACAAVRKRNVPIILAGLACLSLVGSAWAVDPNPLQDAYWRFEEGAVDTNVAVAANAVLDSVNANHMQTANTGTAPMYTSVVATAYVPGAGAPNTRSLRFTPAPDGTTGLDIYTKGGAAPPDGKYINNPIIANGFTLEAAFMPTSLDRFQVIVGKDGKPNSSKNEQTLALKLREDTNELQIELFDGSNTIHGVRSLAPLVANQWYYAAVTNDGTNLKLYLDRNDGNGYVLQGTDPNPLSGALAAIDSSWTIGRGAYNNAPADWFDGYIDEVRISKTVRDPADFLFAPHITYVDAIPNGDGANVTVEGQPVQGGVNMVLDNPGAGDVDTDGLWCERIDVGTRGNKLSSYGAVDAAEDGNNVLQTSTPTLEPGRYLVYLFFWNNYKGQGDWDCPAAIGAKTTLDLVTPGSGWTVYTKEQAISLVGREQIDGFYLPQLLVKENSDQQLMCVRMGDITLSSADPIIVSTAGVHRTDAGAQNYQRTWYEGIGYQRIDDDCDSIPALTLESPILEGATSVTVNGISPNAELVKVYAGTVLVGSAAGSPPSTPASLAVTVRPLALRGRITARQTVAGVEQCGVAPEVLVGRYITYVDATLDGPGANMTLQGAAITSSNVKLNQNDVTQTDDGFWSERYYNSVNGGSVVVSMMALDAASSGILWTNTPTLPAGRYYVYLFFWNGNNNGYNYDISAAIGAKASTGELALYTKANATNLAAQTRFENFDLPPSLITEAQNQDLLCVKLGEKELTSDGPITVSTWGPDFTGVNTERTWFEGIGYMPVWACAEIPDVTFDSPLIPAATTVSVGGISPDAEQVKVYLDEFTLIGSAAGSPPNTPASLTVSVPALVLNSKLSARQVIGGEERCGPATQKYVSGAPRITYVDADPNTNGTNGNTTINGAWVDSTPTTGNATISATPGATGANEGKWHIRTPLATPNGDEIWETVSGEVMAAPLVTTLNLPAGTYRLYGLFWANSATSAWDAAFRVGSTGEFTNFRRENAGVSLVGGGQFVNAVKTRDGGSQLMIATLGEYAVSGPIEIYVNALHVTGSADERTWYDGIGYELVSAPEPQPLLITDDFNDGDRSNDVGLKWYTVMDGTVNQTVTIGPDAAEPVGLGDDNALSVQAGVGAIQVANFTPVMLQHRNDYVRLSFNWRMPELVNFGDTFRFGLFHNSETLPTLDQPRTDLVGDDPGYVITLATGSCSPTSWFGIGYTWFRNPSPLFGQDELILDPVPAYNGTIGDTNSHHVELTIKRQAGSVAEIAVSIDGVPASRALWGPTAVLEVPGRPQPVLSFNQVAFGSSPAAVGVYGTCPLWDGIDYIIDDVTIETGLWVDPCDRPVFADADKDGDVDQADFGEFQRCFMVTLGGEDDPCRCLDVSGPVVGESDGQLDLYDLDAFTACEGGPELSPLCGN